jgi:hypothetical protein
VAETSLAAPAMADARDAPCGQQRFAQQQSFPRSDDALHS